MLASALVGQATTPPATAVAFLKKVKPGMTQAQIRTLLPSSTKFEKPTFVPPVDGSLAGTVVRFSGSVSGTMSFLRAEQIEAFRDFSDKVPSDYQPSDPVHGILLVIKRDKTYSKSKGYGLLSELKKLLGKPNHNPYFSPEWTNDFGGWMAAWKVNGKPLGFYEFQVGQYETRLEFSLGPPIYRDKKHEEIPPATQ